MARGVARAGVTAMTAALGGAFGCGPPAHTRAAGAVTPLAAHEVLWNPSRAPVGKAHAVADLGNRIVVFGDEGATVWSSGAPNGLDRSVTAWRGAGIIPGAGARPGWIFGIDGEGRVRRLRAGGSFEDVSGRFGLEGRRVLGCAPVDGRRVAFQLEQGLVIADGERSTTYAYPGEGEWTSFVAGGGRGAAVSSDHIMVFDPDTASVRAYELPGAAWAALGSDGRLYAATSRALYATRAGGDLALVYDAQAATLHGLVVSGDAVWFADGSEIGLVETDHVAETVGAHVPPDATLAASSNGDVWVIGGEGDIKRWSRALPDVGPLPTWSTTVQPIFARDCASCHGEHGISGVDLSSVGAWESERGEIHERVVVRRSMPPEDHPISEADRDAIRAWAESTR